MMHVGTKKPEADFANSIASGFSSFIKLGDYLNIKI
jgi:hypothetical protein